MSQTSDSTSTGKASNATKSSAACIPCFKRKMKCDRGTPCSNCRRRRDQSEQCHYPTTPSAASVAELKERLEKLENYIRATGVDPDMVIRDKDLAAHMPATPVSAGSTPAPTAVPKVADPLATVWPGRYNWGATIPHRLPSPEGRPDSPVEPLGDADAFRLLRPTRNIPYLAYEYPAASIIQALWRHYTTNVHLCHNFFFEWQKAPLIEKACAATSTLTPEEHAFVLNMMFLSVATLTGERCTELLRKEHSEAVKEYQVLAEYALWDAGVPTVAHFEAFQGLLMFTTGLRVIGLTSGGTLGSLTAIITRQAERLGLHHDGAPLGMTATETEERRRVWWEAITLDLTSGVYTGCVSMIVYSDWTTERPGNYEDSDFAPGQIEFPPTRQGITRMSESLLMHRTFATGRKRGPDGKRLGMAWTYNTTLSDKDKRALADEYSTEMHEQLLQYCEPYDPYHVLIQLGCRKMLTAFQWLHLNPARMNREPNEIEPEIRIELFNIAIRTIEYQGFAMTSEHLKEFVWHNAQSFMWPILIYALVDVRQRIPGTPELDKFWDAIAKLYEKEYSAFRKLRIPVYLATAELVLATWSAHASDEQDAQSPSFVVWLRNNLPSARRTKKVKKQQTAPTNDWAAFSSEDFSADAFLQDLVNIDWSTWDTF